MGKGGLDDREGSSYIAALRQPGLDAHEHL
jgi:hypothetical protein